MRLAVALLISNLAACAQGPTDAPLDPAALAGRYQEALSPEEYQKEREAWEAR